MPDQPRAEELLRFSPPIHHFRRTAMCDVELRDQRIQKGDNGIREMRVELLPA